MLGAHAGLTNADSSEGLRHFGVVESLLGVDAVEATGEEPEKKKREK